MTKKDEFRRLAEDVSRCHICNNMFVKPHVANSECLENDDHGLDTDTPYVNLWNLWQGSLDADIMVIGQDYGCRDGTSLAEEHVKILSDKTSKNLHKLFNCTFGIDCLPNNELLFFTNMANCYRKRRTSGSMHNGWLPICASKFMARLIKIIQPKIIIVLGQKAFEAMFCLDGLPIKRTNPMDVIESDKYEVVMQVSYQIELENKVIEVFPVYHTGANSQMNRSFDQQLEDWKRIKECYDKVKK